MDRREDFAGILMTDCAAHYLGWLKACFGEIVLFCDGLAGQGGRVGWSPREQFVTALWGYRMVGKVAGYAVYALPGVGDDVEAGDLLLDVAFGAAVPFRGYTDVRLVALPRSASEEILEMRAFSQEQASNAAMKEFMHRLRLSGHNT